MEKYTLAADILEADLDDNPGEVADCRLGRLKLPQMRDETGRYAVYHPSCRRCCDGSSFMMAASPLSNVTAASPSLAQVTSPFPQQLVINGDEAQPGPDRPEPRDQLLQAAASTMDEASERRSICLAVGSRSDIFPRVRTLANQPKRKRIERESVSVHPARPPRAIFFARASRLL